mgnify:FL=1
MNEKNKEKNSLKIMSDLVLLVKPMLGIVCLAVLLGVAGFFCATAIPVAGALCLLSVMGYPIGISLRALFLLMAVFAVARGLLRYGEQASNHYIAFKLLAMIRSKVYTVLRRLCPAKLEGNDKGNLIALITSDVELLEVFYAHTISPAAIGFLCSLLFTVFLWRIAPPLGLIALAAYAFIGIVLPVLNEKNVRLSGLHYRNNAGELNTLFLDSLRGLQELMQYDKTTEAGQKIAEKTETAARLQNTLKKNEIKTRNLTDFSVYFFNLLLLFCAFWLFLSGQIDFAQALIATVTLMSSYGPVIALSNLSNNLAQTLASGARVLALLQEAPQTEEQKNGVDVAANDVKIEDVSFRYGAKPILDHLSLEIPAGKITGILGKSGCGKSTLLKLIMRFWDKDSGRILLSGTDVTDINTKSLRENESYCTQETHLFHDTIGNNIRIANLSATDEEIIAAAKKASIHDFIAALPHGYDTRVGELGDTLSGGEKQRISLARAFLSDAPLMLLDEPTSNLDSINEGIILKALDDAKDRTIVLVSHRKSTLGICDSLHQMENGHKNNENLIGE